MQTQQAAPSKASKAADLTPALLMTSPPAVGETQAVTLAARHFDANGPCRTLSGERDRNFRIGSDDGTALTLKFINAAETEAETAMQVAVLKHLQHFSHVPVPRHLPPDHGRQGDWLLWPTQAGQTLRVRAYSFLEGRPGLHLAATTGAWHAVGQAAARLDTALADFRHPAAARDFLWDVCRAAQLLPWLNVIDDAAQRREVERFLPRFAQRLAERLHHLPCQVIHNDMSPSNLLADESGQQVAGVLDFGDMVYAPRIAEAAIAASYLMTQADDPLHTLACLLDGYSATLPLSASEREYALDLVLARLTQRMVITARRAQLFPANRDYILRSQAAASRLFDRLIGPWHAQAAR